MKRILSNSMYGLLDYVAHPLAMLLVVPFMLRGLGVGAYGVWIIATAMISFGGIIASGFGDANIQYIAVTRSRGDLIALLRAVQSMMGVNLLLGVTLAAFAWLVAPAASHRIVPHDVLLQVSCLRSLRIASVLILIRAVESVCISTQRAFERYGSAVGVSVLARMVALAVAALLSHIGVGVVGIMLSTAAVLTAGLVLQLESLRQLVGPQALLPSFDSIAISALLNFGIFSWLLAVAGVVVGQFDRLVVGVSLGTSAVVSYALCVQMAQPIYGIASAGLHFLFPYLAARQATNSPADLRRPVLRALSANLLAILIGAALVELFGLRFLTLWVGPSVASSAASVLTPVVWSFALLGLNVTAYYTLLALGRVRSVALIHLLGGTAMLLVMVWLLPTLGVKGLALARAVYGAVTLLMYLPVASLLRTHRVVVAPQTTPTWEDA